jgi:hypothetical protein
MRPLIPLIVLALITPAGAGRAEFRVTSTPGASTAEPTPSRLSPATARQTTSQSQRPRSILRGFGTGIPLSFAVRQIVPPNVDVAYGPNVNPEQLTVTWRGGRPWLTTLRAAVAPLGLHVVDQPHRITITF